MLSRSIAALLTLAFFAGTGAAHEIPTDVTIQAFVRPQGTTLRVLLRLPLAAMRDTNFGEIDGGYLDLARAQPLLLDAANVWLTNNIDVYEGDAALPPPRLAEARVSLPSDRSFTSWDAALAHVTGPPLPSTTRIYWNQAMMDVLYDYPIHSDRARFSIDPKFGRLGLRVVTVLRFLPPGGAVRAFEFSGDSGLVHLDPRWHQAALRFVRLGFLHILDGTDHLLFLFCLVIPFRKFRALIPIVTAFTVAHSITLIASAYNFAPDALWFPPLIETLIAVSIVYMALENIAGSATAGRRWIIAFAFGLVHGFGFSFALRETLQFAGSHLLTSLLSFNVGVELGQLLVLALMIPALELLFRFAVAERMGTIILSALVAHTGWHWMLERWERLRQFRFQWPELSAVFLLAAARWAMAALLLAVLLWLVSTLLARRAPQQEAEGKARV
ncbi:MAG TPA: HupE/UreJ family protein [Bryobacteraceae bacterium]|nr:HupE/UreJ family protein [Bryobacteraceae bacterium]